MKLIIDIDDNDYELLNKTGITIDWNTAFHGKEKDREMTFAIFNLAKALKNGTPVYEHEKLQGEWVGNAFDEHHCNRCGHPALWEEEPDNYYEVQSNFCPNCGAKMKGGAE